MIPQRVYLKGLLCYRDEQQLYLDDASIWMLAGPNGSGKSAVFDAVTFAMFGYHRGGKTNARELINKDESGLAVEFDFLLEGELFRLRRTASKRGSGTRQISHWLSAAGEHEGSWEAVPDTESDRGFDHWVREHIGLSYESFTSSVLLLQGQAERVLSPRASDRREILESVVDLNRYKRLYERVDEKRKHLRTRAETLGQQLEGTAEVRDSDLVAAQAQVDVRERASQKARDATEQLQYLKSQAEQWNRLEASLVSYRKSHEHAQTLLTSAAAIRTGWQRLQELRVVLPHLKTVVDQRHRFAAAERMIADLSAGEKQISEQITQVETTLAESLQHRQSLETEITIKETRLHAVGKRLREMSELLGRISSFEQQRDELTRLKQQLELLPSDAAETLERTQQELDHLHAISQLISPLTRLRRELDELRQATIRLNEATAAEQILAARVETLKTNCTVLGSQAVAAATPRRHADRNMTEARTLRDQAAQRVQGFNDVARDKTCNRCGQTLTAAHIESERVRLEANLASLELQLTNATKSQFTSEQHEKQILQDKATVEELVIREREWLNEQRQHMQTSRRDQLNHAQACQRIYDDELDDCTRNRVAPNPPSDWLSTNYPTQADLDELRQKVARLSAVRETLRQAKIAFDTFKTVQDRAEFIGKSVAAQQGSLSSDPTTLRYENEQLTLKEWSLKKRLSDCRERLDGEKAAADTLTTQRNDSQRKLSANEAELKGTRNQWSESHGTLAEARNALPLDWQLQAETMTETGLLSLQTELTELVQNGIEARHNALLQAQANVDSLRETVVDLERQRNELPADARQPVNEIEGLLTSAKGQQTECYKSLQEIQLCADRLVQRQRQRRQLREEYLQVSNQHGLYQTLAELLGPRKLQRELVRRAEREIVDLANVMLDRVSGGQLELNLAGQEDHNDDGLDRSVFQLEARNRSTATEPLGVAFLSGSQRFRVAVSLALGIGQYSSARRRSIQSVIIDEGFGSLDREGRQVMIQELQNLRGYLERIVLVSHQEEFADAFPDGYRFELKNGATQISRFHR